MLPNWGSRWLFGFSYVVNHRVEANSRRFSNDSLGQCFLGCFCFLFLSMFTFVFVELLVFFFPFCLRFLNVQFFVFP